MLKDDKATLCACSLAAREFSCPALSYIGQHITVNYTPRIKRCAQLLTSHSAFQHVRSLDLGVTSKSANPKDYLQEQLTILEIFAQRQVLTCLWLSNFPFPSIESSQRGKIRDVVTALTSTVDNLGLYGCRFPSYTDMISFVRAFPRCDSLSIWDCVIGGPNSTENMFSGLPEHKLSLDFLELAATSNGLIIDVSSLIEDAALDVSQLSALTCVVISAEQARCVAMATSASPIRHLQLACTEPGGFRGMCRIPSGLSLLLSFSSHIQAFFNPMAKTWSLRSLTIGPMSHKTDRAFWDDAFQNFPAVPRLEELIITYFYPRASAFDINCWAHFTSMSSRLDIFPRSMKVDLRTTIRPCVTFWGSRKQGLFQSMSSISPDYHPSPAFPITVSPSSHNASLCPE